MRSWCARKMIANFAYRPIQQGGSLRVARRLHLMSLAMEYSKVRPLLAACVSSLPALLHQLISLISRHCLNSTQNMQPKPEQLLQPNVRVLFPSWKKMKQTQKTPRNNPEGQLGFSPICQKGYGNSILVKETVDHVCDIARAGIYKQNIIIIAYPAVAAISRRQAIKIRIINPVAIGKEGRA